MPSTPRPWIVVVVVLAFTLLMTRWRRECHVHRKRSVSDAIDLISMLDADTRTTAGRVFVNVTGDQSIMELTVVRTSRIQLTIDLAFAVDAAHVGGDFVETGTFRGGSALAMARARDALPWRRERALWLADSFAGLPPPTDGDAPSHGLTRGRAGLFRASREGLE